MRILELIRYYSLQQLQQQRCEGLNIPLHQLWNWDYFQALGNEMIESVPKPLTKSRILQQLLMHNFEQQQDALRKSKSVDVIFAPFIGDAYLIALARCLRICKTPLVAIAQETWRLDYSCSFKNQVKLLFVRYLAKHGVDRLLFISENLYNQCSDYFTDHNRQIALQHWGVDLDYYDQYIVKQKKTTSGDYIFVTGGANRDFYLMKDVSSFDSLKLPLFVQTNRCPKDLRSSNNLKIDCSPKQWDDLLSGYYNSYAVGVPLLYDLNYMSGITVVLEGMACKKPIISSASQQYPFNLEKEKAGIYVPIGDAKGWVDAINYLHDNPDEAREMGERGRYIVEHKHNYKMFCEEINEHITNVFLE